MVGLPPCNISVGVISGPNVLLKDKSLSYQDSKSRARACNEDVNKKIKKKSYKNKDKTPLAVKISAGILLLASVFVFLKYKIKK